LGGGGGAVGDVGLYFVLIFMLLKEGKHATEDHRELNNESTVI